MILFDFSILHPFSSLLTKPPPISPQTAETTRPLSSTMPSISFLLWEERFSGAIGPSTAYIWIPDAPACFAFFIPSSIPTLKESTITPILKSDIHFTPQIFIWNA
jgi:hypothetical protein